MSVYRPAGERLYRYDFQLRSRRFYGPTGCATKKAAEAVERQIKAEARARLNQPSDTLDAIAGRWWDEKGRHRKDQKDVEYRLERILFALGPNKRAIELRQRDVAAYVATRRVQPIKGAVLTDRITAPATINRELDVMRAAWRYAIKCGMDLPGIDWSAERLAEPETRERVATEAEEDAIFQHLRPDYAPFFAAILETGWRWGMASSLRWSDDRGDVIQREGKGGRMIRTPVTRFLRALIEEQLQGAPALRRSALDQPSLDTIGERLVVESTAVLREDLGALDHRARLGANGRLDGLSQGRENDVVTWTLALRGEADGVFGLLHSEYTGQAENPKRHN